MSSTFYSYLLSHYSQMALTWLKEVEVEVVNLYRYKAGAADQVPVLSKDTSLQCRKLLPEITSIQEYCQALGRVSSAICTIFLQLG